MQYFSANALLSAPKRYWEEEPARVRGECCRTGGIRAAIGGYLGFRRAPYRRPPTENGGPFLLWSGSIKFSHRPWKDHRLVMQTNPWPGPEPARESHIFMVYGVPKGHGQLRLILCPPDRIIGTLLLPGETEEGARWEGNGSVFIETSAFHRRHFINFFLIAYINLVKKGSESFLLQTVEDLSLFG